MTRIVAVSAIVLFALGLAPAGASEPASGVPTELPPKIQAACARARGNLAYVCAEYEKVHRELERRDRLDIAREEEARQKLKALTRGGIIHVLE